MTEETGLVKREDFRVLAPLGDSESQDEALPEFMQTAEPEGTEDLGNYIRPPRLKVIQRNASPELLEQFDAGDVILTPQNVVVAPVGKNEAGKPTGKGTPFAFVPLYFFPEWVVVNPIQYKGTEPFIRDRSLDPTSEIARKSRSPETWSEPHPTRPKDDNGKDAMIRYTECLNFVILLVGVQGMEGVPVVMSFSKTGHKTGTNLAMLIRMRRAPIYGCVFEAEVGERSNSQGNWLGLNVRNPKGLPQFVQDGEEFELLKAQHLELKGKQIDVSHEDADDEFDSEPPVDDKF